jgi:aspartyl-tRNA(Asn)/glutamyl-tRNA(Gln) amidotransferase subunit A
MSSLKERRALSLGALAADLATGKITSRELVEDCLARIGADGGEGQRTFITVDADGARNAADAYDKLRAAGYAPSPFAGIPISIKDLFDIKGTQTRAGSIALNDAPPARDDAPMIARLRSAGFILIGRTNMTEFAYSGLGLNPHYDTPKSIWNRDVGHVPGGSSSGAAVSVADGMAHAGLGTDTGGSCRIPAAFNYLTGFKPTATRVTRQGAIPLSNSLDSIGSIARTVSCCSTVDRIIADLPQREAAERKPYQIRIGVLRALVETGIESAVSQAYEAALTKLSKAGVELHDLEIPELDQLPALGEHGGLSAAESFAWHQSLLAREGDQYDPRVKSRIMRGSEQSAAHYARTLERRRQFVEAVSKRIDVFDAIAMPTVPILPPAIDALANDDEYTRLNLLVLRNPALINLMDGCAISLPVTAQDNPPVGLMLAASGGRDAELFSIATAIETIVGV